MHKVQEEVVVHVRVMKIYVAAVELLKKKEK
jgi:hypothetical protein